MKYIIPFALFALTAFSCGNETEESIVSNTDIFVEPDSCDCRELGFDESYNNFYLVEPRNGFTGICEEFYANGQVSLSKHFTEGKVDGKLERFYESGKQKEELLFNMNLQTGDHFKYTEDGRVLFHATYKDGKQLEILVRPPAEMILY